MRENHKYSLEIDFGAEHVRIVGDVRLQLQQQIPYDLNGQTGNNMPEYKQIVIEFVVLDLLEFVFQIFNAVDGAVGQDFVLGHIDLCYCFNLYSQILIIGSNNWAIIPRRRTTRQTHWHGLESQFLASNAEKVLIKVLQVLVFGFKQIVQQNQSMINPQNLEYLIDKTEVQRTKSASLQLKKVFLNTLSKYDNGLALKKDIVRRFDKENRLNHRSSWSFDNLLLNFHQNLYKFGMNQMRQVVGCCLDGYFRYQNQIRFKEILDTLYERGRQKYYIPTLSSDKVRMVIYEYHWNHYEMQHPLQQTKTKPVNQKILNSQVLSIIKDEKNAKDENTGKGGNRTKQKITGKNEQLKFAHTIKDFVSKIVVKDFQRHNFRFNGKEFESDAKLKVQIKLASKQVGKQQPENKPKYKLIKAYSQVKFKEPNTNQKYCQMYEKRFQEYQSKGNGSAAIKKQVQNSQLKLKQFRINSVKVIPDQSTKVKQTSQPKRTQLLKKDSKITGKQSTINSQINFEPNVGSYASQGMSNSINVTQNDRMFNSIKISMIDSLVKQTEQEERVTQPNYTKSVAKSGKMGLLEKQREITGILFKKLQITKRN